MNHHDAEITEVVICLDCPQERIEEISARLRLLGLDISRLDPEERVVEGSIDAQKVHDLQKVECVKYVRSVFTYVADYPTGDPRDLDGVEQRYDDPDD